MCVIVDLHIFRSFAGEDGSKNTTKIKAEIDSHLEKKATVESTFPQSIIIGPFLVITDTVRVALAKKHKDITRALLDFLVETLRKETTLISEEFNQISRKLFEMSNCIEELTEQREYMKTIPEIVATHQSRIDQTMGEYDMLEAFYYQLSDEDFESR